MYFLKLLINLFFDLLFVEDVICMISTKLCITKHYNVVDVGAVLYDSEIKMSSVNCARFIINMISFLR